MAPGFPSEPGDRGGDERVEGEVSNATDKEVRSSVARCPWSLEAAF